MLEYIYEYMLVCVKKRESEHESVRMVHSIELKFSRHITLFKISIPCFIKLTLRTFAKAKNQLTEEFFKKF